MAIPFSAYVVGGNEITNIDASMNTGQQAAAPATPAPHR
jgi:hypothetical protein